MKLHRFWILCLLMAAGRFALGQGFVVSYGNSTSLCQPPTTVSTKVPTCFSALSYSWGASSAFPLGTGGATKPSVSPVSVLKALDDTTTALFLDMLTAKAIPQVLVAYYKSAKDAQAQTPTYTVLLTNAIVTSEQASDVSSSAGSSVESIGLVYESIKISYFPQNANGSWDAPVEVTYNLKTNRVS
jgi:type VI protein secretion system component Hcp